MELTGQRLFDNVNRLEAEIEQLRALGGERRRSIRALDPAIDGERTTKAGQIHVRAADNMRATRGLSIIAHARGGAGSG
jgi:hypothetical protein